jgi:hypothetical protein
VSSYVRRKSFHLQQHSRWRVPLGNPPYLTHINEVARGTFYLMTYGLCCVAVVSRVGGAYRKSLAPWEQWHIKGPYVSIAASVLAAIVVAIIFFAVPDWSLAGDFQMRSDFAVMWLLLTYL